MDTVQIQKWIQCKCYPALFTNSYYKKENNHTYIKDFGSTVAMRIWKAARNIFNKKSIEINKMPARRLEKILKS